MKQQWALPIIALVSVTMSAAGRQSPRVTEVEFQSGGSTIRGRFFSTGSNALATLLLLPGADFDPTDVLELGHLLSAADVNVVVRGAGYARQ